MPWELFLRIWVLSRNHPHRVPILDVFPEIRCDKTVQSEIIMVGERGKGRGAPQMRRASSLVMCKTELIRIYLAALASFLSFTSGSLNRGIKRSKPVKVRTRILTTEIMDIQLFTMISQTLISTMGNTAVAMAR